MVARQRRILAPFRINPNIYIFLSAIFVAQFVNLFTSVFGADKRPDRYVELSVSAALALLSGVIWSLLAWQLEAIERVAYAGDQGGEGASRKTWEDLAVAVQFRLVSLFILGLTAGICSLVVLV